MADNDESRFDVSDPRFEGANGPTTDPEERRDEDVAPPPTRSRRTSCLVGCLTVFGVIVVLLVVAGFWIARNFRGIASSLAEQAIDQGIDASDLPAQEKQEIKAEVRRLTTAYRDGRLSNEQLGRLVEQFANSPLLSLFVVTAVERQYFDKSGLSEEEKIAGRNTLRRFVRGAADGDIPEESIEDVFQHIGDRQPDGNWRLRETVTDADLRAALAEAKQAADAAGVPEQPEEVDPSEEFKRIVDDAIGPDEI